VGGCTRSRLQMGWTRQIDGALRCDRQSAGQWVADVKQGSHVSQLYPVAACEPAYAPRRGRIKREKFIHSMGAANSLTRSMLAPGARAFKGPVGVPCLAQQSFLFTGNID